MTCCSVRLRTNPRTGQPCSGLWLLAWQGTELAEVYLHEVPPAAADLALVAGASAAGDSSHNAAGDSSHGAAAASSSAASSTGTSAASHDYTRYRAEVYAEVSERFMQLLLELRYQQQLQRLLQQHPAAAQQDRSPAAVAKMLCAVSDLSQRHCSVRRRAEHQGWAHVLGLPADTEPAVLVLAAVQAHVMDVVSVNASSSRAAGSTVRTVSVLPVGAATLSAAAAAQLQHSAACRQAEAAGGGGAGVPMGDAAQLCRDLQLLAAFGMPLLDLAGLLQPEGEAMISPGGDGGVGSGAWWAGAGAAAEGSSAGAGAGTGAAGSATPSSNWHAAAGLLAERIRAIPENHPNMTVLLLPVLLPPGSARGMCSDREAADDEEELELPCVVLPAAAAAAAGPAAASAPMLPWARGYPAWHPPELPQPPPCPKFSELRACMEPAFEELARVVRQLPALQHVVLPRRCCWPLLGPAQGGGWGLPGSGLMGAC